MKDIMLLLVISALSSASMSEPSRVTTAKEACVVVKARVLAQHHLPKSTTAFCDDIAEADGLLGYFVMALHSGRQCDGICSTNMGWFAVRKSTGDVFDWDVAEWKLGQPADGHP